MSTLAGVRSRESEGKTVKEFLTVMGRMGRPVSMAKIKAPFLKGLTSLSQFLFHHPFYFKPDESADHRDVCHALMVDHHHIGVVAVI